MRLSICGERPCGHACHRLSLARGALAAMNFAKLVAPLKKGENMKKALVLVAALAACGTAQAAGVGVKIGTTGLGIDVAKNIAPLLDARVGYSGGSWGYDANTSGANYKGDIKLSNLNALLDFHPLGPLFRISGGVIFNKNKYEATGTVNGQPGSV